MLAEAVTALNSGANQYPNSPFAMTAAGVINTAAYSVWLNDINSLSRSVLFGGLDTAKYTGTLQTVPIVPLGISNGTPKYQPGSGQSTPTAKIRLPHIFCHSHYVIQSIVMYI
jgi:Eukaryotic aspartyl protease